MACLEFKGILKGHGDMVTSICTASASDSNVVLSSSRDKSLIVWDMTTQGYACDGTVEVGTAKKSLTGHGEAVQDCALSAAMGGDKFAVSASWDNSLRLWDLEKGTMARKFSGHTSDVNSVDFSSDSRQVVSGSRDKTIKVWNTRSECKFTSQPENSHTDWVSCVAFSPATKSPCIVSASWDKTIKVWSLTDWSVKHEFTDGHDAPIHNVTVSPDGSLCASGGKDSSCVLWDLFHEKKVYTLDSKDKDFGAVNSLAFSPCNYWLCAAMDRSIRIWELEEKAELCDIVLQYQPTMKELRKAKANVDIDVDNKERHVDMVERSTKAIYTTLPGQAPSRTLPWATCLEWDYSGSTLFVGTSTGDILVFEDITRSARGQ